MSLQLLFERYIEYAVLPEKLAIWVITKTRFELTEKTIISQQFEEKINNYRTSIIEKDETGKSKLLAEELYKLLLPNNLERDKILCLIPDKSLYQIPFSSLVAPNGKYLIEDFAEAVLQGRKPSCRFGLPER